MVLSLLVIERKPDLDKLKNSKIIFVVGGPGNFVLFIFLLIIKELLFDKDQEKVHNVNESFNNMVIHI